MQRFLILSSHTSLLLLSIKLSVRCHSSHASTLTAVLQHQLWCYSCSCHHNRKGRPGLATLCLLASCQKDKTTTCFCPSSGVCISSPVLKQQPLLCTRLHIRVRWAHSWLLTQVGTNASDRVCNHCLQPIWLNLFRYDHLP